MERPSFTRQMEAAKRQAVHIRNTGRHYGASAKGWNWQRPSDPDDYRARAQIAQEQLRLDVQSAWSNYCSAVLNIRHGEELDAIPF